MRNQATTNAHNNERLKERIRPLLVASDGVAEPVIGPARLMRIVSEIWNAVISADESDPYCFSSVWLQVSECLRNESVATGKKERFGLFVVALESFLEVLNRRLLAFSDDQIVSVFSGLQ
ncbi:MAG TPA: hypothetical protein PK765_00970 [bacterium]|nr:hypothetical protein [bacterium]